MIVKDYIKRFEKLGFGMFVHYGLYSVLGKGEWVQNIYKISREEYEPLTGKFSPKKDWAAELARTAKLAGCKYITLTTRHHDGFSLYDTRGLSDYDAPHACGRDLIAEYVDACRAEGIVPFFYHTLIDWHAESLFPDFASYLKYLRDSVEVLCTKYGKIGGIWFDGMWAYPDADWQEDALYSMIRKNQPEAMIINNTGLSALGELGHPELDSVTFERGNPAPVNLEGSPKYIASEMCQTLNDHWAYAAEDCDYKSSKELIENLADCRRCLSNFLLNVGPRADGSLGEMEKGLLGLLGLWVKKNGEAIYDVRPSAIRTENREDFVLESADNYYVFIRNVPMTADPNVAKVCAEKQGCLLKTEEKLSDAVWLDSGEPVELKTETEGVSVPVVPFAYGTSLCVRVARIPKSKK